MAVDIKKKPIKINAIEANATFVTILCEEAYISIIQTPNNVPKAIDKIPGIPRKGRGLSSTTSLINDIKRPIPCLAEFSVDVFTPTVSAYLHEIGTSQILKSLFWTVRSSSMLALMPFSEMVPRLSMHVCCRL